MNPQCYYTLASYYKIISQANRNMQVTFTGSSSPNVKLQALIKLFAFPKKSARKKENNEKKKKK